MVRFRFKVPSANGQLGEAGAHDLLQGRIVIAAQSGTHRQDTGKQPVWATETPHPYVPVNAEILSPGE
jgi:hypothetical protein